MDILRSFVYLDVVALNDYLSSLIGPIYDEESIIEKKSGGFDGSIGGGIGGISAKVGGKKGSEIQTSHTAKLTDAAKFQNLYNLLFENDSFQYFETMDKETWSALKRNSIVEAVVNLRFSKLSQMFEIVDSISQYGDIVEKVSGQSVIDNQAIEAISGFKMLSALEKNKGIPCVMPFIMNNEYKLIATLQTEFMRSTKESMSGELTVFGKITRILGEKDKFELVELIPGLDKIPMNREQKRKMPKKNIMSPPELKDTIKGPAAIISPLAIYK